MFSLLCFCFVFCIVLHSTFVFGQKKPCDGVLGQQFRPDPHDCRVYHLCGKGKDWTIQCGPNLVWNQKLGTCVPTGSANDTCSKKIKSLPPMKPSPPVASMNLRSPTEWRYSPFGASTWRPNCPRGSKQRFAHPTKCAQYYDCGADPREDWFGKNLRECPYPTVFDEITGNCGYYTEVNCGKRQLPLDPCDYMFHTCRTSHCAPCFVKFATCAGMRNGVNIWRGREKTPFFVVCKDQRVVFHGKCVPSQPGKREIFDQKHNTCMRPKDQNAGRVPPIDLKGKAAEQIALPSKIIGPQIVPDPGPHRLTPFAHTDIPANMQFANQGRNMSIGPITIVTTPSPTQGQHSGAHQQQFVNQNQGPPQQSPHHNQPQSGPMQGPQQGQFQGQQQRPQQSPFQGQQQGPGPQQNSFQRQQQGPGPQQHPFQGQQQGPGPQQHPFQGQQQGPGPQQNPFQGQQQGPGIQQSPYQGQQQGPGPQQSPYQGQQQGPGPQQNPFQGQQQQGPGPQQSPYQGQQQGPGPQQSSYQKQQGPQQSPYQGSQQIPQGNYNQQNNAGAYQNQQHTSQPPNQGPPNQQYNTQQQQSQSYQNPPLPSNQQATGPWQTKTTKQPQHVTNWPAGLGHPTQTQQTSFSGSGAEAAWMQYNGGKISKTAGTQKINIQRSHESTIHVQNNAPGMFSHSSQHETTFIQPTPYYPGGAPPAGNIQPTNVPVQQQPLHQGQPQQQHNPTTQQQSNAQQQQYVNNPEQVQQNQNNQIQNSQQQIQASNVPTNEFFGQGVKRQKIQSNPPNQVRSEFVTSGVKRERIMKGKTPPTQFMNTQTNSFHPQQSNMKFSKTAPPQYMNTQTNSFHPQQSNMKTSGPAVNPRLHPPNKNSFSYQSVQAQNSMNRAPAQNLYVQNQQPNRNNPQPTQQVQNQQAQYTLKPKVNVKVQTQWQQQNRVPNVLSQFPGSNNQWSNQQQRRNQAPQTGNPNQNTPYNMQNQQQQQRTSGPRLSEFTQNEVKIQRIQPQFPTVASPYKVMSAQPTNMYMNTNSFQRSAFSRRA